MIDFIIIFGLGIVLIVNLICLLMLFRIFDQAEVSDVADFELEKGKDDQIRVKLKPTKK